MTASLPGKAMLALIDFYRAAISPLLPPACRYEPTCSEYARIAIERHGAGRGAWLALRRLARCHPFGGSGWDPVPDADGPSDARAVHERDQVDGADS